MNKKAREKTVNRHGSTQVRKHALTYHSTLHSGVTNEVELPKRGALIFVLHQKLEPTD
jgi:hypothetical protein